MSITQTAERKALYSLIEDIEGQLSEIIAEARAANEKLPDGCVECVSNLMRLLCCDECSIWL